jgi:hypothetical protein
MSGTSLAWVVRRAGLTDIVRKGWLVERWAPVPAYALSPSDCEALAAAAADPDRLFDDPDFCFRECFVVTLGRIPA